MRIEDGCEERGGVVGVAIVVVPVVVEDHLAVVPDGVHRIAVAVRTTQKCARCRLFLSSNLLDATTHRILSGLYRIRHLIQ